VHISVLTKILHTKIKILRAVVHSCYGPWKYGPNLVHTHT